MSTFSGSLKRRNQRNTDRPCIGPPAVSALTDTDDRVVPRHRHRKIHRARRLERLDLNRRRLPLARLRASAASARFPCASRSTSRARWSPSLARRALPLRLRSRRRSLLRRDRRCRAGCISDRACLLCSLRLGSSLGSGGCLTSNPLHERPVLQKVGRCRQRTRVSVHLEPIEICRARAVGVGCRDFELENDVSSTRLATSSVTGRGTYTIGAKRRPLPAARSMSTTEQGRQKAIQRGS